MIHPDPKIQAILETTHSMLRSLSDRPFSYEANRTMTMWEITVHCGSQHSQIQLHAEPVDRYPHPFEDTARRIAFSLVAQWINAFSKPVDSGVIYISRKPIQQAIPDATGDPT
jgi:hypothetical protein